MNYKTTFVLLVLAAAVGALLWPQSPVPGWLGLASTTAPTKADATFADLAKLKPEKIRKIKVERGGDTIFEMTGTPAHRDDKDTLVWTLPGNWPTRPQEAEELVGIVTNWSHRFTPVVLDPTPDLKPYGLEPPAVVVTVETDDGKYKLKFGEEPGTSNRFSRPTYLRLNDNPEVVRLGPGIVSTLSRNVEYYQQRRLFPVERVVQDGAPGKKTERLVASLVQAQGPQGNYTLHRLRKDEPQLILHEEWGDDHVNPEKLNSLLTSVPELWAEFFVNEKKPLTEYGLDKPERTLRVSGTDGKEVALLIGKESPRKEERTVTRPPLPFGPPMPPMMETVTETFRYAKLENNDQIFEIRDGKLKDIFVAADTLRDAALARFKPEDVQKLEVVRGDFTLVAVKGEGDKWRLEKPIACDAETIKITDLVSKLSTLEATGPDVITTKDKKAYDLETPAATVTLTIEEKPKDDKAEKKTRTVTFQLGKDDAAKKKLYLQVAGWERINAVDDSLATLVNRPAIAYRGRNVLDFFPGDLAKVEVKRGDETYTLAKENANWRLTQPVSASVDAAKVDKLTGDLGRLLVVEFVSEDPKEEELANFGLDKPTATLTLGFTDEKKPTKTLRIGKPRGATGEHYAKLESAPQVFVIRKEDSDLIDQPSLAYRPLQLWQVPTGDVTAVQIQRGDEPAYRVAKSGKDWKVTTPFEAPVAGPLAESLLVPLATIRAQRYEAHTAKDLETYGLDKPSLRVTVVSEEKKGDGPAAVKEHTLLVGKPTAEGAKTRFAKLAEEPGVVVVDEKLIGPADRSALDLLDHDLLKVDPKTITKLQSAVGDAPWSLERKDNAWLVEAAGAKFAPDASTLGDTLAAWTTLRAERFVAYGPKVELAEYGLDKPTTTLVLTTQVDGKPVEHKLAIGKTVKGDTGDRFARLDDGGIVVLSSVAAYDLNRSYLDFVDHVLLDIDPVTITSIRRKVGTQELELTRKDNAWRLTKPNDQRGDDPSLDRLAQSLARLRGDRAAAYPAKDVKAYGLDEPAAVVTLVLTDNDGKATDKVLKIGSAVGEGGKDRYAMFDGGDKVIVLPGALSQTLLAKPLKFRDRNIARFGDADKVVIERGDRKATFAKVDGTWKLVAPTEAEAEQADLDEFVNDFARLRADELVAERADITPAELKTFGLDKPEVRWHFKSGDKEVLSIQVGGPEKAGPNARHYARLADGDVVFLLSPKSSNRTLAEYRHRALWPPLDAAQMERLVYVTPKGSTVLEKGTNGWQVSGKPEVLLSTPAVNETLAALGNLKAERFVADKGADLKLYGLEPPQIKVEALTRTGGKCVLHIGHAEGDSNRYYARIGEGDHTDVFVLSEADSARIVRDLAAFAVKKDAP
jgi:hypothetical protein